MNRIIGGRVRPGRDWGSTVILDRLPWRSQRNEGALLPDRIGIQAPHSDRALVRSSVIEAILSAA